MLMIIFKSQPLSKYKSQDGDHIFSIKYSNFRLGFFFFTKTRGFWHWHLLVPYFKRVYSVVKNCPAKGSTSRHLVLKKQTCIIMNIIILQSKKNVEPEYMHKFIEYDRKVTRESFQTYSCSNKSNFGPDVYLCRFSDKSQSLCIQFILVNRTFIRKR